MEVTIDQVLEKFKNFQKWGYAAEQASDDEMNLIKLANCMVKEFHLGEIYGFLAPIIYKKACDECPLSNICKSKVSA